MTPSSAETQDPNAPYLDTIRQTKRALRAAMPDLKERFAALTQQIEAQVQAIEAERAAGLPTVPSIQAADLEHLDRATIDRVRQRGCVVVRGVFDPARVQAWNVEVADYLERNQYLEKEVSKRGIDKYFSALASSRPQIFGVYWSGPQMEARQSEELARVRRWLNHLWAFEHAGKQVFNPDLECTYSDRVRQRQPGDKTLGLSPHTDGGSIERWIDPGYQQVYRHVFGGNIHQYNAFDAAFRTETREIPSPAVCRMFRTFQGWTALTAQGPGDGTLRVAPIANAMAWVLLRALQDDVPEDSLCGARAGRALGVNAEFHSLILRAYGPIPKVEQGDTVWWHPDVIHGVEDEHTGSVSSNVMYIGAAPDCEKNRSFLALQRPAFEAGLSSPDFAPENYEVDFIGRATPADLTPLGLRQMGFSNG
jgi:hypothetical protein